MFRGLTRTEYRFGLLIVAVIVVGATMHARRRETTATAVLSGPVLHHAPGELTMRGQEPPPLIEGLVEGRVDVNRAGPELLDTLPGIGPTRAEAIVRSRQTEGPFRRPEDLLRIPGIGAKTLQNLLPYITVEAPPEAEPLAVPHVSTPVPSPPPALPRPINVNSASIEELTELDGVGTALAARIVEDRARRGPFRNAEDLTRVSGIGPRIIERNRHRIAVR
jgi:competence protein ComEA